MQKRIIQSYFIFFILLLLATFTFIVNKGFDFTDEGWYIMTASYPNNYKLSINLSEFYLYSHQLLKINNSIIFLRLVSLLLYAFSILFLTISFIKWVISLNFFSSLNPRFIFAPLFSMSLIFGSLQYQIPMTLNYNALTAFLTYIILGIIFIISTNYKHLYLRNLIIMILGFILGNLFFIKFTTAILLFLIVLLLMWFKLIKNVKKSNYIYLIAGIILAIILFFIFLQSPAEFISHILNWLTLNQIMPSSHGSVLLWYYIKSITKLLITCCIGYILLLVTKCLIKRIRFYNSSLKQNPNIKLIYIMYIYLLIYFILHFVNYNSQSLAISIPRFLVIIIFINLYVCYELRHLLISALKNDLYSIIIISILLFITPLICSFGSVNDLVTFGTIFIVPWALLIFIIAAILSVHLNKLQLLLYTMLFSSIIMLIGFFAIIIFTPYRLFDNYFKESIPIKIANNALYADKKTAIFIRDLNVTMKKCGFRPHDFIVSLYDYTGIIFAINGLVYGCDLYDRGNLKSYNAAEFCSTSMTKASFGNIYVMVTHKYDSNNTNIQNISNLKIGNSIFPYDYKFCGNITAPNAMFISGEKFIKNIDIYKPNY